MGKRKQPPRGGGKGPTSFLLPAAVVGLLLAVVAFLLCPRAKGGSELIRIPVVLGYAWSAIMMAPYSFPWPFFGQEAMLSLKPVEMSTTSAGGEPLAATPPVWRAADVLSEEECDTLIKEGVQGFGWGTHEDSIDGQPAMEHYAILEGEAQCSAATETLLRKAAADLTPAIRRAFDNPHAAPCTWLLRRYAPGERRGVRCTS